MPNGKQGDHPYTDMVIHHLDVYSRKATELVRQIAQLGDEKTRRELGDMLWREYNPYNKPDVAKLEGVLSELRDRVYKEARARGYEVDGE